MSRGGEDETRRTELAWLRHGESGAHDREASREEDAAAVAAERAASMKAISSSDTISTGMSGTDGSFVVVPVEGEVEHVGEECGGDDVGIPRRRVFRALRVDCMIFSL